MMLRRKLLIVFGGLAFLSLLVAGVGFWSTIRWQATAGEVEQHYRRSLLLQRVRASTFQALKEVDDGLTGDSLDARRDFERALLPAAQDFAQWTMLADTARERREVASVRDAYGDLVGDARRVFDLIDAGRRGEAVQLLDDELDTRDVERFRVLTEEGIAADRSRRRDVRANVEQVRRTTQILLVIALISILSLVLLFAAYLAQDLFRPLRELERALRDLAGGDARRRMDDSRSDEFGAVGKAFNAAASGIETRLQGSANDEGAGAGWAQTPSRVTLHTLVARLRSRLNDLPRGTDDDTGAARVEVDALAQAVGRLTQIGFPLDLELARVDVRTLVHGVLERFREPIVARAVSLEITLDPQVADIRIDRLKIREALAEIVTNALAALPERGGLLGVRIYRADGGRTMIEVADDGRGMDGDMIERAVGRDPFDGGPEPHVGLALAKAVVEQHGGTLAVMSEAGRGTVVQLAFPAGR